MNFHQSTTHVQEDKFKVPQTTEEGQSKPTSHPSLEIISNETCANQYQSMNYSQYKLIEFFSIIYQQSYIGSMNVLSCENTRRNVQNEHTIPMSFTVVIVTETESQNLNHASGKKFMTNVHRENSSSQQHLSSDRKQFPSKYGKHIDFSCTRFEKIIVSCRICLILQYKNMKLRSIKNAVIDEYHTPSRGLDHFFFKAYIYHSNAKNNPMNDHSSSLTPLS